MMRDLDAEYDELMDELEAVVKQAAPDRGERLRVIRLRIEDLVREQIGIGARLEKPISTLFSTH